MDNIEAGDMVSHKTKVTLNGGLAFNVIEVDGDKALCEYFGNDKDQTLQKEWFNIEDLVVVHKVDGGWGKGF